jgi:hypothetical protein
MTGPIALVLLGFKYGVPLASAVVIVDALRRPATHFPKPWWRWLWVVPQVVLLALAAVVAFGPTLVTQGFADLILAWGFICVVMDVGYLLEVVFPSPEDRAKRTSRRAGGSGPAPLPEEPGPDDDTDGGDAPDDPQAPPPGED